MSDFLADLLGAVAPVVADLDKAVKGRKKLRIIHSYYGCDSGSCGHRVETEDGDPRKFTFVFGHAASENQRDLVAFAIAMVGAHNVTDVDFERSDIWDWERC